MFPLPMRLGIAAKSSPSPAGHGLPSLCDCSSGVCVRESLFADDGKLRAQQPRFRRNCSRVGDHGGELGIKGWGRGSAGGGYTSGRDKGALQWVWKEMDARDVLNAGVMLMIDVLNAGVMLMIDASNAGVMLMIAKKQEPLVGSSESIFV